MAGDLPGLEAVGNGDQQPARLGDVGQFQHAGTGGIAEDHAVALFAQFVGLVALVHHYHEGRPGGAQASADQPANPAMTDQHRMLALQDRRRQVLRRHLADPASGLRQALLLALLQAIDGDEQQRIDQDRQDRPGQHQVAALLRHQFEANAQADENEGKLADLRQAGGDHQCGAVRMAESTDDQVGGHRLAEDDDQEGGQDRQRLLQQDHRIEQHPHRDEEQHRESVAQRQRVLRRLVAEFGLVEDHPGEEGA